MGVLGNNIRLGASASGEYEIERSIRFNDGDWPYFYRTPSSAGNQKTWTYSCWFKLSGNFGGHRGAFLKAGADGNNYLKINVASDNKLYVLETRGGAYKEYYKSDNVFKDSTGWIHLVVRLDTTNSTDSEKVRVYINGTEQSGAAAHNPTASQDLYVNSATKTEVGAASNDNQYFDGYMAEVNLVDGQTLEPSSFAKIDSITGAWVPKKFAGAYGTNGFYLNFSDNSGTTATTLGKDSSGNGHNFTTANFSIASGVGYDSMLDTPTNNFCTLNSLEHGYGTSTYSEGNLQVAASNAWVPQRGSMAVSSGKWYWEVYGADGNSFIGVAPVNTDLQSINPMLRDGVIVYYGSDGKKRIDGTFTTYGSAYGSSNVIGVALDIDNGKLYFAEDNTWQNSGDPTSGSTGTGAINLSDATGLVGSEIIPFFCKNGTSYKVNFGQQPFTHTPPADYKTICANNLPDPTIKNGREHFDTILYTGNATSRNIVSNFATDFVWIKRRNANESHVLSDRVRGANKLMMSDTTAGTNSASNCVTAFNSDGVTVGTQGIVNDNGQTFVSWHWKGGTSNTNNTAGTINSTVRANVDAGFSIATYTGDNASGASTVGHGLGVAPEMVIVKRRDASGDWIVGHEGLHGSAAFANNKFLKLESSSGTFTNSLVWGAEPTSTVVQITTGAGAGNLNASGGTYVMYSFVSVTGYCKVDSYFGNGGSNGPFAYCGFKPAFIMMKAENGNNWATFDVKRDPYNSVDERLHPNLNNPTNAGAGVVIDICSNGFKCINSDSLENPSGASVSFIAFAENPINYSNGR